MLEEFVKRFTTKTIPFKRIGDTFYLENTRLNKICFDRPDPVLFGCCLGTITNNVFHPSFIVLEILSKWTDEKVIVNDRGEIDFLYGKHLRKRHIICIEGSEKPNVLKLVQNQQDENLGYGKFIGISEKKAQVLRNIMDRGEFIKRDKLQE